jgi:membrane-associated phospholipid phosphatase
MTTPATLSADRSNVGRVAPKRQWLAVAAIAAVLVYGAMWVGFVQRWAWLGAVDSRCLQIFHGFGVTHPGWVSFWVVFCVVFGPGGFRLLVLPVIGVALIRRDMRTALFLFVSVELSALVAIAAKELGNRPRPLTALIHADSTSFPSGHAVSVSVGVLALLTIFWPAVPKRLELPVIAIAGGLIFLVGFSRVALNVHNPSDVVAGWALGFLYYLLCLRLIPPRSIGSPVWSAQRRP